MNEVQIVEVDGRVDGTYVFAERIDADRFARAVEENGGSCSLPIRYPVIDAETTVRLIREEASRE